MKTTLFAALASCLTALVLVPASASAKVVSFQTKSGNIGCVIDSKSSARCDIKSKTWKAPRKPGSCKLDYGNALTVGNRGRGKFACAGDTALGNGKRMRTGAVISAGRFFCKVTARTVLCRNQSSTHGFIIGKQFYLLG